MDERITNRYNQTIGFLRERADDILAMDTRGMHLGYYVPRNDMTYNARSMPIGRGNRLMSLFD